MQRIGRFTVVRELGHGGMGSVYLAKDPELEREVAIKLLHRTTAGKSSARAQFREEARALARMSHSGIVTIFETGDHEGQQFIAMEYLEGRSLRELLIGEPKPARDRLLAICADVARAVAAAHARGILHRDIKPENVVVGEDGSVKVVDFGLARRLGVVTLPAATTLASLEAAAFDQTIRLLEEAEAATHALATLHSSDDNATAMTEAPNHGTVAGTLYGTPAYMAPEVLQGASASEATDVYSLGVMLYECLGGRRPYVANTLIELISTVIDVSTPPTPLADPAWPLIARMLSRDSDERPGLLEIAERLAPIAIAPPPKRRRAVVVAGAATALLAGAVAWGVTRDDSPTTVDHPIGKPIVIAVDDIKTKLESWGAGQPSSYANGDIVARLVGGIGGVKVIGPFDLKPELDPEKPDSVASARRLGANRFVRGEIKQKIGTSALGEIELIDLDTGARVAFSVAGSVDDLPLILRGVATQVAEHIRPGTTLASPDRALARTFYELGQRQLGQLDWYGSRPYLEQAIATDPTLTEAWGAVAESRGWTIAPQQVTIGGLESAVRSEPDPRRKEVWRGAVQFHRGELRAAIATLLPLSTDEAMPRTVQNSLLFYLGDALWHDGQPDEAMKYFRRLLERDDPFTLARAHAREYAVMRRDYPGIERYETFERARASAQIARGEYAAAIAGGRSPFVFQARVLSGSVTTADLEGLDPLDRWLYEIAAADDPAKATAAFDTSWPTFKVKPVNAISERLTMLQEIVLVAGFERPLREVLALVADRGPRPFSQDHQLPIAAAPILEPGVPKQFPRDPLTTRTQRVAAAIEAELANDRATAIRILQELVRAPMSNWDYVERAALIRNLAAAKRTNELVAECREIQKPAVFRYAWVPLARICKNHIAARR